MLIFHPDFFDLFLIFCFDVLYLSQLAELGRLSTSMKKIEKELKGSDKHQVGLLYALMVD